MPTAELRGQRLHYEDSGGDGLPVVLSHGFLQDSEMFDAQVSALRGSHRVITWDQRGHGKTHASTDTYTYWDSADDLAALLDCLHVERAVVGGMSQGGFISLRFALAHPQRTAALILIDSQAGQEDPDKTDRYDLMHDVWTTSGASDQLLDMVAAIIIGNRAPESAEWVRKWKAKDPATLTPIYRVLMDRDDVTPRLPEIEVPVLMIHGTEDVAIDLSVAESDCSKLPNCRLVKIEGAGHSSNITHPEPVNAAIEEFLSTL